MLILIDNFDSFTYNVFQAFACLGEEVYVVRNDQLSAEQLFSMEPKGIIIGPGPGNPDGGGISLACVDLGIPTLGICLGHQAIAAHFGGNVQRARQVMHGKTSQIYHNGHPLFANVSSPFEAARYHSLIAAPSPALNIIAWTGNEEVMAIAHPEKPIYGLQFHPESIATPEGAQILRNFLQFKVLT